MTKLVAMTFEEASQWIASQEKRIKALEDLIRDAVPVLSEHADLSERARELLTQEA